MNKCLSSFNKTFYEDIQPIFGLLPKAVCNKTMKLEERQVGEDTAGQILKRLQLSLQAQTYKVVAEYGLVENIRARGQITTTTMKQQVF